MQKRGSDSSQSVSRDGERFTPEADQALGHYDGFISASGRDSTSLLRRVCHFILRFVLRKKSCVFIFLNNFFTKSRVSNVQDTQREYVQDKFQFYVKGNFVA